MRTEKNEQQTLGRSAAFSGHRHISPDRAPTLMRNLDGTIVRLYEEGVTTFYCGMAMGFDLMAAESVLNLRAHHPEVRKICLSFGADHPEVGKPCPSFGADFPEVGKLCPSFRAEFCRV